MEKTNATIFRNKKKVVIHSYMQVMKKHDNKIVNCPHFEKQPLMAGKQHLIQQLKDQMSFQKSMLTLSGEPNLFKSGVAI